MTEWVNVLKKRRDRKCALELLSFIVTHTHVAPNAVPHSSLNPGPSEREMQ